MIEIMPFLMVIAIIAIVQWNKTQRARLERPAGAGEEDGGEADRLRGELRQLRDRVQVLERILTDGERGRALALEHEIEALRDERRTRQAEERP